MTARYMIGKFFEVIGMMVVGMALFAVVGAGLGYVGVKMVWRWKLSRRLRERTQRRATTRYPA